MPVITELNNGDGILFFMEPSMFCKFLCHIEGKYDGAIRQGVINNFFGIGSSASEFQNDLAGSDRPIYLYKSTRNPSDVIWAKVVFDEIGNVRDDDDKPFDENCYMMEMPGCRMGNYCFSHFMVLGS